jgi:hypothetical protein
MLDQPAIFTLMATGYETRGRRASGQFVHAFYHEIFDAEALLKDLLIAEDQACFEAELVGRQVREFAGIAPTNAKICVPFCVVYELAQGKIMRGRLYFETDALRKRANAGRRELGEESRKVMALSSENVMSLTTLVAHGINELQQFRSKVSSADRHAVEIVRRALVEQTDEAWSALQQCFSEPIRVWIRSHPSSDVALLRDSEENYIAQTFSRFWSAVHHQHIEFTTLPAALAYLHATLNGVLTDTLRSHIRLCSREVPLPGPDLFIEPSAEEPFENELLWESMHSLLNDKRERRIFYLLYYCGLKPRDIVARCPQEFSGVKEIYRLNHNIIERLRRNSGRLRYMFGSEE